jgi:hypothetical protein
VRLVPAAAGALVAALSFPAGAVEREHHLGVGAGASMLVMSDKTHVGAVAGAHWAYGLTDAFNLMAEGAWSLATPGERLQVKGAPRGVTNVDVGLGYVFDVLRWVPYAGALVGGYALTGGTVDGAKILPAIAIALGLDYRLGRSWAVGVAFRQHLLFTDMSDYPSFTHLFARFEYTWGW